MKKKILFTTFNLGIGGIEKCLVNLVNSLDKDKYDITIFLQVKEGEYLKDVDKHIKVIGYDLSNFKGKRINNKIIRLVVNVFKYIKCYIISILLIPSINYSTKVFLQSKLGFSK